MLFAFFSAGASSSATTCSSPLRNPRRRRRCCSPVIAASSASRSGSSTSAAVAWTRLKSIMFTSSARQRGPARVRVALHASIIHALRAGGCAQRARATKKIVHEYDALTRRRPRATGSARRRGRAAASARRRAAARSRRASSARAAGGGRAVLVRHRRVLERLHRLAHAGVPLDRLVRADRAAEADHVAALRLLERGGCAFGASVSACSRCSYAFRVHSIRPPSQPAVRPSAASAFRWWSSSARRAATPAAARARARRASRRPSGSRIAARRCASSSSSSVGAWMAAGPASAAAGVDIVHAPRGLTAEQARCSCRRRAADWRRSPRLS